MTPEGWVSVSVGEIADIVSGGTPSTSVPEYWDGGIPWCTPTDVTGSEGMLLTRTERSISEAGLAASSANLLPAGSLLLCTRATIGDVRIAAQPTATNQGFKSLIVHPPNSSTFFYFLISSLKDRLIERSSGSTFLELSKRDLERFVLLAPPPAEQKAIAEALTDAASLVESLDALIAKKRDLGQAAMLELLEGRVRLPGSSGTWERVRIGDFAEILKGRGLSRTSIDSAGRSRCMLYGELFTTYGQVVREVGGRTNESAGTPSHSGDVLMPGSTTTSGEDLATATALLQDNVMLGGDINIIRPNRRRIDSRWLAYRITHCHKHDVARASQGTTIHHLYGRGIAALSVLLPSRDEQARIADVIEEFDSEVAALTAQRDKAELVKQGMIQELLSGRVRLT